jgi:hypothetical protein
VFDLESLNRLVSQSRLEVVESGGYFLKPFTHQQMSALPFLDDRMLDGLMRLGAELPDLASEIYVNVIAVTDASSDA